MAVSQSQSTIEPQSEASPTEQSDPLWRLPLEIRYSIYDYVLSCDSTFYLDVESTFEAVKIREKIGAIAGNGAKGV
jgi:hypothetical protein